MGKRWSHDSCPLCKSIKGIVFSAVGCWMVCSNVSDDFQSTEMFSWRLRFLHSAACCSIFLRPPCGKTFYYRERKSRTEKMLSVSALFLCGCENGLREAARLAGSSRASPEKPAAGWCCEDFLRAETGEKGGTISKTTSTPMQIVKATPPAQLIKMLPITFPSPTIRSRRISAMLPCRLPSMWSGPARLCRVVM